MEKLTFEQLPQAVQELTEKVDRLTEMVERFLSEKEKGSVDKWMDIDEFCAHHPEKPRKPTVYTWASKGKVPHFSKGKKLYFLKSEIDAWLKDGRKKTVEEIKAEAQSHIKSRKYTK